jgi:hypothetical protein
LLVEARHGLMCDARRISATEQPVTAQDPFQFNSNCFLNCPWPSLASISACLVVDRSVSMAFSCEKLPTRRHLNPCG